MNYKYARYVGFSDKIKCKYWIKYTDNSVEGGQFPGIDAVGYSFEKEGSIYPWISGGFFPFSSSMKFFQEIRHCDLPAKLKEKK